MTVDGFAAPLLLCHAYVKVDDMSAVQEQFDGVPSCCGADMKMLTKDAGKKALHVQHHYNT